MISVTPVIVKYMKKNLDIAKKIVSPLALRSIEVPLQYYMKQFTGIFLF